MTTDIFLALMKFAFYQNKNKVEAMSLYTYVPSIPEMLILRDTPSSLRFTAGSMKR